MKQYSLQSTALGALNLESMLLPENQANAFESASSVTGYHLDQFKANYTSHRFLCRGNSEMDVFGEFDSHARALLPVTVFPPSVRGDVNA